MSKDLRKKLIYSLLAALLVYVALALWSDWQALVQALLDFPWAWLPVVVALTLVNYGATAQVAVVPARGRRGHPSARQRPHLRRGHAHGDDAGQGGRVSQELHGQE
ncbi:MAG: hypothetical protein R3A10_20000 [Caldilineaceae bacterium]